MYDTIIVGARCGGSPLAMLLARAGQRVLLVDRATFPSETLSTHQIQVPGVQRLDRWGLLDRVRATNAPPTSHVYFDQGDGLVLEGAWPDGGVAFSVRRSKLDLLLLDAAIEAGAEVRTAFTVDEVLTDQGVVSGITGRTGDGPSVTERATLTVGADGHQSLVARAVQAPIYSDRGVLACCYYTYFADLPLRGFEMYGRGRRAIGLMPTNDGLVCAFTSWPREEFHAFRADIEGNFLGTCDLAPELGERVRAARRAERFYGTANLPNFFRTPYGPGWALVGDAGYVLDPVTGQGIGDAFRDVELLVEAIVSGDFAGYERKRNKAAMPMFELTTDLASYRPPEPRKVGVLRALVGNQEQTDRFFGVLSGAVAMSDFFGPVNLLRILGPVGLAKLLVAA